MPVIALLGNKGGAGKTTLCINLANGFAERGSTLLLDSDPQQSSFHWHAIDDGAGCLSVANASENLDGDINANRGNADFLLVDCPPSIQSDQTRHALVNADLVLIPVQPSPLDLWASVQIEEEIEQARADNPALKALLVINQLEPRTKISQAMRSALSELSLDAAETAIRRRMIYRSSIIQGRSVFQSGVQGAEAAEEVRQLINEMVNQL